MGEDRIWTADLLVSPHGAPDKASRVRRMFNSIAPRYEIVNSLFSLRRDAFWRRRAVELAAVRSDDDVLDVGCGTGDFARAFEKAGPRRVVGCDFAREMLIRAASGSERIPDRAAAARDRSSDRATDGEGTRVSHWVEADALRLPFRECGFSIAACAFGVRNFVDLDLGLREMHRVLRPGGRAVILEFTRPPSPVFRRLFEFYANRIMPVAASLVSGDRSGAYRYLPRSVVSFIDAGQMCARLRDAGFARVTATPFTMGAVTIYVADRA